MRLQLRIERLEQSVSEDKTIEFQVVPDDAEHDSDEWIDIGGGLYRLIDDS